MTPSVTTALRPPLYSTYGWTERLGILDLLAPFFLSSPDSSSRKALEKAGLKGSDLDLIEANEAVGAQAAYCCRELLLHKRNQLVQQKFENLFQLPNLSKQRQSY